MSHFTVPCAIRYGLYINLPFLIRGTISRLTVPGNTVDITEINVPSFTCSSTFFTASIRYE